MSEPITREDIAEIYEQLGVIEMRRVQELVKNDPRIDESSLDRAFEFYHRADEYRKIDAMKPLRKDILHPDMYVRAESNDW